MPTYPWQDPDWAQVPEQERHALFNAVVTQDPEYSALPVDEKMAIRTAAIGAISEPRPATPEEQGITGPPVTVGGVLKTAGQAYTPPALAALGALEPRLALPQPVPDLVPVETPQAGGPVWQQARPEVSMRAAGPGDITPPRYMAAPAPYPVQLGKEFLEASGGVGRNVADIAAGAVAPQIGPEIVAQIVQAAGPVLQKVVEGGLHLPPGSYSEIPVPKTPIMENPAKAATEFAVGAAPWMALPMGGLSAVASSALFSLMSGVEPAQQGRWADAAKTVVQTAAGLGILHGAHVTLRALKARLTESPMRPPPHISEVVGRKFLNLEPNQQAALVEWAAPPVGPSGNATGVELPGNQGTTTVPQESQATQEGVTRARPIFVNQRGPDVGGQVGEGGVENRGGNLQQAAPEPPNVPGAPGGRPPEVAAQPPQAGQPKETPPQVALTTIGNRILWNGNEWDVSGTLRQGKTTFVLLGKGNNPKRVSLNTLIRDGAKATETPAISPVVEKAGEQIPPRIEERPLSAPDEYPRLSQREVEAQAADVARDLMLPTQETEGVLELWRTRARAWEKAFGRPAEEWYGRTFARIERGTVVEQEARTAAAFGREEIHPTLKAEVEATAKRLNISFEEARAALEPHNRVAGIATQFGDGRTALRFFRGANVKNFLHETGHVFFNEMPVEERLGLRRIYALKEGEAWTRNHEERFVLDFQEYLRTGEAPVPAAKTIFERFKVWLSELLRGQERILNPELRDFYDRMLGKEEGKPTAPEAVPPRPPMVPPQAPQGPPTVPPRVPERPPIDYRSPAVQREDARADRELERRGRAWFLDVNDKPVYTDRKTATDEGMRGPFTKQYVSEATGVSPEELKTTPVQNVAPPPEVPTVSPEAVPAPVTPRQKESARRAAISAKNKVRATGLTTTQEKYLQDQLRKRYEELPSSYTKAAGGTFEEGGPVAIKVPGDGEFTVESRETAEHLNRMVGGKPIEEARAREAKRRYSSTKYTAARVEPSRAPGLTPEQVIGALGSPEKAYAWLLRQRKTQGDYGYELDPVIEKVANQVTDPVERAIIKADGNVDDALSAARNRLVSAEDALSTAQSEKFPGWKQDVEDAALEINKTRSVVAALEQRRATRDVPPVTTAVEAGARPEQSPPGERGAAAVGVFVPESVAEAAANPVKTYQRLRDFVSIDPVPKLQRAGVADEAVQHAAARQAVPHMVDDLLAKVFGKVTPDAQAKVIDILNKDNVLAGYDAMLAKDPETAAEIAAKHDLAAYEKDVQAAKGDKDIGAAIDRWKKYVNPLLDQLYHEQKRIDPGTEQVDRGRFFQARINLLPGNRAAMWSEMVRDTSKPMPESSPASYRNPNVKRDPYARTARFTGDYSTDPKLVLTAVLGPRWNEVTKLHFYDALVKKGVALELQPGEAGPDTIQGKPTARLPIKVPETVEGRTRMVEKSLMVRRDLAREIRDVLGTDMPAAQNPIARLLTNFQLAQIADAVTHAKNLQTVVARAQGSGSAWKDVIRKMPALNTVDAIGRILQVAREVHADSPEIRSEIAGMAKQGLIRPHYPPTGMQRITHGQQFLHRVDTAARIVMNRFFDNLVERKLAKDTVSNRRQFINQVGNYNRRLMGPIQRAFRDMGVSPFIVAGRNFNRQGRRMLTGTPGLEASGPAAAAQLRAINLFGTALTLSVFPMILNSITTGNPGGRPGTPLGAWDLGTDNKNGRHKIVDLAQWTGLRRGLRVTGLDAAIEGLRNGRDVNTISGQMADQITQNLAHPWIGPAAGFLLKTIGGFQPDIRGRFAPQHIPEGGMKQKVENLRAAVESQNPLVYAAGRPLFQKAKLDQKPEQDYALNFIQTVLQSPATAFGVKDVSEAVTPAEELAAHFNRDRLPELSPEEQRQSKARREIVGQMRQGQEPQIPPDFTRRQVLSMRRSARTDRFVASFKPLPVEEAEKVWERATEEQRKDVRIFFLKKLENALRNSRDPEERARLKGLRQGIRAER
jgi:hypothetical protein